MMGRLQADETGFGWTNNALIDVTQSLNTCHDNVCEGLGGDKDGNPSTYDPYNQYTLSFNGVGYELIHASGKAANGQPGRYYAQGNAGLYIELCKAPLSAYCNHLSDQNPMTYTVSNVVWRITGADGTTYRLGGTANSEQGLLQLEDAPDVRNKALRWRVDTVVDRFGNIMEYKYVEDNYDGWVHSEYFHAQASYVEEITYDTYTIEFIHLQLPYDVYRTQGYGYSVSYHTRYLGQIKVMNGTQQIRHYSLSQGFGRYGQDNDTDNLPLEPTLDAIYGTQSPWCAAFEYVLDFKYEEPEDNVTYVPHKTPALLSIHEGGSDQSAKSMSPDTVFRYVFLGTGQYDHRDTDRRHLRYCFPYLDTVETIYGPAGVTPTTLRAPDPTQLGQFTPDAYDHVAQAAASLPDGSTLVVGVDWDGGNGHWFNAVVQNGQLTWVDAQTGQTHGWPPSYGDNIAGIDVVYRQTGSDPWKELVLK